MVNCETLFYRNRLAVPKARKIKTQETLIDDPVFEDFVKHAFATFRQNPGLEALRQAIDLVVSSQEGTIEASFLKCFAALETLVTLYRQSAVSARYSIRSHGPLSRMTSNHS